MGIFDKLVSGFGGNSDQEPKEISLIKANAQYIENALYEYYCRKDTPPCPPDGQDYGTMLLYVQADLYYRFLKLKDSKDPSYKTFFKPGYIEENINYSILQIVNFLMQDAAVKKKKTTNNYFKKDTSYSDRARESLNKRQALFHLFDTSIQNDGNQRTR
ncbi:MAG: hypothetical protein K6G37_03070 [Bacilli bacterium]|nr:hypothetical protein [Bacilli bacterium]